jgi:hypothetical protein
MLVLIDTNALLSLMIELDKWYRGKVGFILSVTLIAAIIVPSILYLSTKTRRQEFYTFTYHLESHSEKHNLTVNVDLSNGMNLSEAVQVAYALFDDCMGTWQREAVSANMTEQGMWAVQLSWDYGHWFRATIDPANQTIVYNHCR